MNSSQATNYADNASTGFGLSTTKIPVVKHKYRYPEYRPAFIALYIIYLQSDNRNDIYNNAFP